MAKATTGVLDILKQLELFYGKQEPSWPTDPYLFLVWWHCGYPASDARCSKGWESLSKDVGVSISEILAASPDRLANALKSGGMVPELRAFRLKEIAARVKDQFGGDLSSALRGSPEQARKILKTFPNIADPGADRILLFAGIAPVAAIPSNCPHVLVRIQFGQERQNYGSTYREAQQTVETEIPAKHDARNRAYLLLKRHGQEICKTKPKCPQCPVKSKCAYFAGKRGARGARA